MTLAPNALTSAIALNTSTPESRSLIGSQSLQSFLGGTKPQVAFNPNALKINSFLNNVSFLSNFSNTVIVAPLNLFINVISPTVQGSIFRNVKIFTRNQQPKNTNKINALRRITKSNIVKSQTHAGL